MDLLQTHWLQSTEDGLCDRQQIAENLMVGMRVCACRVVNEDGPDLIAGQIQPFANVSSCYCLRRSYIRPRDLFTKCKFL